MKSYLALVRGSLQISLMYRLGFVLAILGNMVYLGVTYYLWRSIYRHSETIRGLTFDETFLYVALGSTVFILLKTYTDWIMSYEIREGLITNYLIKPLDLQLYMLSMSFGSMLMNLLAITIPTALVLAFVFKVNISLGIGLALFPLSLFLAFLISFSFDYFIGLLAFYTESTWGITIMKEVIITVLSGALIPLQFFPEGMQSILRWLPFQAIYHTPLMMVTRPQQSLETFVLMLAIQVVWVVVLFVLTRLFYHQAIKVLRISGG
jgi:ABC-2 type transport system permease protein